MTKVYNLGHAVGTDSMTGKVLKILGAQGSALAAGGVVNLTLGSTSYRVTAGKTFYPLYFFTYASAVVGGARISLIYADNSALTTNAVYISTQGAVPANMSPIVSLVGTSIPASKYIGIQNDGASNANNIYFGLVGYEV